MLEDRAADQVIERMAREAVVPVIVIHRARDAAPLAAALAAGGCSLIEITLRTEAALEAIAALSGVSAVIVGAGTVLDAAQLRAARDAGARFIISPGLDPAVVQAAQSMQLFAVPGVSTASEIQAARKLGTRIVKFFPAKGAGGPAALRALAATYPDMRFMPTGGIAEGDLRDYLLVPSVIACGGSWLAPAELIDAGDFAEITRRTAAARAIARDALRERGATAAP